MITESWKDQETLEELARKHRFNEILSGVIRSSLVMKIPVINDDGTKTVTEGDTLLVALPGGITGYCPASEFREREFRSLTRFVGTTQQFIITGLNLEEKVALLSEKRAAAQLRTEFWEDLLTKEVAGTLQEDMYEAVITGINQKNRNIFVRINGQDAFLFNRDWSWNRRDVVDAQIGETIQVKIERIDTENKRIQVSRKLALPDPKDFISSLRVNQVIAGKVSGIDPIHGLFVTVENNIVLKAGKVRKLEEPDIGDIVTCRVRSTSPEERQGKVIIIDYPRGKRKRKDLGSFLFE
ncbi:S1 RNA-binding domain-containing protein [Bacillus infantis]|uniref:S1 RNA-binding domain-containing protein n=1 Tax=Bacillus infantis TaxID=324767 RepID=A0A5D4SBP1_9BACI|nr:S1 RNA-binding domain-containing protein [Bacillus infantis]TYS60690.1 S1 RNA-binding domain-containing protein [Bacillus infantis]